MTTQNTCLWLCVKTVIDHKKSLTRIGRRQNLVSCVYSLSNEKAFDWLHVFRVIQERKGMSQKPKQKFRNSVVSQTQDQSIEGDERAGTGQCPRLCAKELQGSYQGMFTRLLTLHLFKTACQCRPIFDVVTA